jgi:hypothetical protein
MLEEGGERGGGWRVYKPGEWARSGTGERGWGGERRRGGVGGAKFLGSLL